MVEKMTSDIRLGDKVYNGVWMVRLDTADGGTVELCHYEEAFAEGKEEGLGQGYDQGYEEGLVDGREEGIQSEYDRFWDAYQDGGSIHSYQRAFAGIGWNNNTFWPKYDIKPTTGYGASEIFWNSRMTNVAARLEEIGVVLDMSRAVYAASAFQGAHSSRWPLVDLSNATSFDYGFAGAQVQTVDMLISNENLSYTGAFSTASNLTTITFGGVIGKDINFSWSPLSVDSMKSVITHLKNYGGTADAGKKTVKFTEACWTALEADSVAPDGNTWRDYVETTLGWLT